MSSNFYSDFTEGSSKLWKQKIQADLKGADYNETLIWKTSEGIDVKPFYHADEFKDLPKISNSKATEWKIGQIIDVVDAQKANKIAIDIINRGADAIKFNIYNDTISISDLFKNIDLKKTIVEIECKFLSQDFVRKIVEFHSTNKNLILGSDIISNLAKTGNWYHNLKEDHLNFEAIVKSTKQLVINLGLYQNAGATIVQQLAYGLAQTNEYLNHLDTLLSTEDKKNLNISFKVAIGSNYFFEIAKLRALRQLWALVASEYGFNEDCQIIAVPSERNKTIYDYNVNMLRTTTESMSAVLGGANLIYNLPYDGLYHNANEFGDRISRNQLLILKYESYFNAVNNPSDGSYYIESLTTQICENTLKLFKEIEANGGFLKMLKTGTIQKKIKESAQKEQKEFDEGKIALLGTNKHPNPSDKMKENLEKRPFLEVKSRKTLIEPILEKRLAETVEQKRLINE